jgi:hypothetical protein
MPVFKTITKRQLIKSVPIRWLAQYPNGKFLVLEKIAALDLDKCDAKAIDDIIGNDTWTKLDCDSCGKDSPIVTEMPDMYELHYGPKYYCGNCLRSAANAIWDTLNERPEGSEVADPTPLKKLD